MRAFSSFFLVAAILVAFLGNAVADDVLFSDDFEANTAVTMPTQAADPAYPISPGTDMEWTIAYDTVGTNAQVWNNVDPSYPADDAGDDKYLAFNHNMGTADAVAWAHGWDPETTLDQKVELSFDLWVQSSLFPLDRYFCTTTYDGPEGSWWSSGRAWSLQFRSDGSIVYYDAPNFTDTGLTFTTDTWQHVALAADLEARTYTLTVEGSSVDLSWSHDQDTHKIQALYLQSCKAGGTSAVDNLSFTVSTTELLPGDLNGDDFVGGDDLDIVRSFWGQNVTAGDLLAGDPSGDGFVGGDDLDIVRANWGTGTPPAPSAVPEPATLALALTGLLATWIIRRRRP